MLKDPLLRQFPVLNRLNARVAIYSARKKQASRKKQDEPSENTPLSENEVKVFDIIYNKAIEQSAPFSPEGKQLLDKIVAHYGKREILDTYLNSKHVFGFPNRWLFYIALPFWIFLAVIYTSPSIKTAYFNVIPTNMNGAVSGAIALLAITIARWLYTRTPEAVRREDDLHTIITEGVRL